MAPKDGLLHPCGTACLRLVVVASLLYVAVEPRKQIAAHRLQEKASWFALVLTTMAKSKLKSLAVKLVSTAGTGYFYVTRKNARNVQHKLQLRKYDPVVRKHVVFSETKLK